MKPEQIDTLVIDGANLKKLQTYAMEAFDDLGPTLPYEEAQILVSVMALQQLMHDYKIPFGALVHDSFLRETKDDQKED